MKKIPLILIIAGLVLIFAFTGQDYNGMLLIFIALLIIFFSRAGKTAKRIVAAVLAVCIGYFIVVEVPIVKSSVGNEKQDADYLIVLGAAIYGETPSLAMVERCDAAIKYIKSNPDCIAIVSGGQGNDEIVSEAEIMHRLLVKGGISEDRILVEDKSFSTYENIMNSSHLLADPDATLAVCTSEYHLYRAKLIGRTLGFELIGVPAKTGHISTRCNYYIREAFGVTYQWIFN